MAAVECTPTIPSPPWVGHVSPSYDYHYGFTLMSNEGMGNSRGITCLIKSPFVPCPNCHSDWNIPSRCLPALATSFRLKRAKPG